jgi:hypothetical protein
MLLGGDNFEPFGLRSPELIFFIIMRNYYIGNFGRKGIWVFGEFGRFFGEGKGIGGEQLC